MEPRSASYDYIIAGMGCAGLSLAVQLIQSGIPFKKVLLIDKDSKTKNDRTWCFWSTEPSTWYEPVIYKTWDHFRFHAKEFDKVFELHPFSYKMIRGIDFYDFCLKQLRVDDRFELLFENVVEIGTSNNAAYLKTEAAEYTAHTLFNSIFKHQKIRSNHINYIQHFKGWLIESEESVFDETCPVFMDFDTAQENDCLFFYVIPFSKNKALIEYTGFSERVLAEEVYTHKLQAYIADRYKLKNYTVLEVESGQIPMAESEFVNPYGNRVVNIGVSGGSSKPSTGYTFYFIQKNTQEIISQLEKGVTTIASPKRKARFLLYDKILLDVIHRKELSASNVFEDLFRKNKVQSLLSFLNERSSFKEELFIFNTVNKPQFIKSALNKITGR